MTLEQTTQLLRLISNLWTNLKVTEDTVASWHFVLHEEDPKKLLSFMHAALKSGELSSEFPPTPQQLLKLFTDSEKDFESPDIIFEQGPSVASSLIAQQAWQLWGGKSRWGMLPDPKFHDDPEHAMQTLRFEKLRFKDIFQSLLAEGAHANLSLSHEESKNFLECSGFGKLLGNLLMSEPK